MKLVFYIFLVHLAWDGNLLAKEKEGPGRDAQSTEISPLKKNGKPLNLDFESGSLEDWSALGLAFTQQPIAGDSVSARRADMKSEHQGKYWVGTFERGGDDLTGVLTSVPFQITQPFASFLIGGGAHPNTRVELVRADTKEIIFKASGAESENLRPVTVDLQPWANKEIFIRVVDEQTGHWGHINFDKFRFHAQKPLYAQATESSRPREAMPDLDQVSHAGLSPEEAARAIKLPKGFSTTLFAGEPDVQQPIAMALDHRGRLWIAEAYTYPSRAPEGEGKDRILIFEDTNGDGKFDKRTVFIEKLNLVSGLEVGFGGVWVGAPPYLLFIPDRNQDDKPDSEPQVLLDGWAYQDTHETLNTFTWGPDGWLYGCHGVFTHSIVGKPGTDREGRTRINAGVWRYHPIEHRFEVFAEGTSNPWGIDFDEKGQCFIEACVIPHLFHVIQGARYHRQGGQHFNPHTYDDIKTIADHVHYAGNKGPHAANNRSDSEGGGHAHAGLMFYLGGSWPEEYRGQIFMNNIHGQRLNMDIPERRGSGFVGKHGKDFLNFDDKWSQVLNFFYDQDGSVYIIDWYDKNQCHHNNSAGHDRSNGRIFKVNYGQTPVSRVDLQKASDLELVNFQKHKNEWYPRQSRRILQERAARNPVAPAAIRALKGMLDNSEPTTRLRSLWTLHTIGALDESLAIKQLSANDEYLRAWTVQFLSEKKSAALSRLGKMAKEDKSPVVRLYLTSALQKMEPDQRWDILRGLNSHGEDATDHNLPLLVWYGLEGTVPVSMDRALEIALNSKLPNILTFTARRVAALGTPAAYDLLVATLEKSREEKTLLSVLNGFAAGIKGQKEIPMPSGWEKVETSFEKNLNPEIRAQAQALGLTFGSQRALASLRTTVQNPSANPGIRRTALDSLLSAKDASLPSMLRELLKDQSLRSDVLKALASSEDPATPPAILNVYDSLVPAEKRLAVNTLSSRLTFAQKLLSAIEEGRVSAKDLTADVVRQLRSFKQTDLDQKIKKLWGVARETGEDKQKEIARYKKIYQAGGSQPGDASRGRAVYNRICVQCHTLFDSGGKVGPDLTGSNRADLDYILQNMVDPNAVIPNEYQSKTIETKDDRIITGILKETNAAAMTILTTTETLTVPRIDIKSIQEQDLSMMPEEMLAPLSEQEVRDLIYYLRGPAQAALPAGTN